MGEGGGCYKTGVGSKWSLTPTKEKGGGNVLAMLKGGTTCFEIVLTWECEVLAIVMGGHTMFPLFKSGGGGAGRTKFYPVLRRGGAQKVSNPRFCHFVAPPLPIFNDQSLTTKRTDCNHKEKRLFPPSSPLADHVPPTKYEQGVCFRLRHFLSTQSSESDPEDLVSQYGGGSGHKGRISSLNKLSVKFKGCISLPPVSFIFL